MRPPVDAPVLETLGGDGLYLAAVVLTAYLVLGITGMGSALVVVPLLAGRWPLPEVVALAILLDIPASILHSGLNLKQVRWPELIRLVPGIAVGSLAGLWLLGTMSKTWPLLALGVYIVFISVRALLPLRQAKPTAPAWGHLAGVLIGLINVMFATAGPIVVAWLQKRLKEVAELRASVPVVMVLAGLIAIGVLWTSGQLDLQRVGPRWMMALPVAAAGIVMGNRIAAHIPPLLMKRLFSVLLLAAGLSLIRQAWA